MNLKTWYCPEGHGHGLVRAETVDPFKGYCHTCDDFVLLGPGPDGDVILSTDESEGFALLAEAAGEQGQVDADVHGALLSLADERAGATGQGMRAVAFDLAYNGLDQARAWAVDSLAESDEFTPDYRDGVREAVDFIDLALACKGVRV